jgi:hypothetical protein
MFREDRDARGEKGRTPAQMRQDYAHIRVFALPAHHDEVCRSLEGLVGHLIRE